MPLLPGNTIFYEELGEGLPLVFIHGWAMSGRAWQFQKEGFSSGHRVILPDLRGHGNSIVPHPERMTLSDLAADLAELFRILDLERALLVGWSLGGQVALEAFSSIREQLSGMVLVGTTPCFVGNGDFPHGLSPNEVRGMALRLKRDYTKTMGDFFRSMFAPGEMSHDQYQKVVREIVINGKLPEPAVAQQGLELLMKGDSRRVLSEIDKPVLLVHGDCDGICLPAASGYMKEQIPGALLEEMHGCGHAPFMSRPEEFNRLINLFLSRVYAGH